MKLLDLGEAQVEQLKQISKYLLQVRQERSIRIEEVAAKTHIRLAFLKALEAGKFEELPEPVYVQGFIRRYGDAVGLDGSALANSFTINIIPSEAKNNNTTNNDSQNLDSRRNIHIPLFVPYILLLAIASIGLIYVLNPKLILETFAKQQNLISTSKQKTAPSPQVESLRQQPSSVPTAPSLAVAPSESTAKNVAVTLELQDKSWLRVKVDGKIEFVGELKKGERRTWTAEKQLSVRSGNAGAILVTVNNRPATPLGNKGAIKEVTFTPEVNSQESGVRSQ
ncbi:helix-turn-helix domain-containing protein [Nostocaceae cyanobacterium CENA369]|uniref:Helix-turn-helix domain-containing protein n=1 Tax=Dendronalium phyllosphericum CENA369 TaxID=1725256 RepID=A0A8J7LEV6_9NOST|nr:RodZ family helix-turn-helix domain-containing protein [Dendronalium phyllosphericum]MBH8573169.1 helix-turn-helix domain-containing protein [Dendronalium phyllosphericum CENA369]